MDLTIREAATLLGKSARTVRHMAKTGALPARRVGGRWVVRRDDLVAIDPAFAERRAEVVEVARTRVNAALDRLVPAGPNTAAPAEAAVPTKGDGASTEPAVTAPSEAAGPTPECDWYSVRGVAAFAAFADAARALEARRTKASDARLDRAAEHLQGFLARLVEGIHQFQPPKKAQRLTAARDAACAAVAELLYLDAVQPDDEVRAVAELIERDVLRGLRGLLRRAEAPDR